MRRSHHWEKREAEVDLRDLELQDHMDSDVRMRSQASSLELSCSTTVSRAEVEISDVFRDLEQDVSHDEVAELADLVLMLNSVDQSLPRVDITEIFSPPRFTAEATRYGLSPGIAIDLSTFRPDGQHWDLLVFNIVLI